MWMEQAEEYVLHTYNRYPIVLDHGKGVYLYDTEGKQYLDFMSGIGVCALGYGDKQYEEALIAQVKKLIHTSNMVYTEPLAKAAKYVVEATGMNRVFFTNSGAEAIEGALKLSRKYALKRGYKNRTEIIAMNHSFHGRTMGAVSVTGKEAYRTPFEPLIHGVSFAEFNDLDSVKALVNEKTCAIILEPLQGEGGIHLATQEFIQGVRELCTKNDILMIADEVQCGMGRTGKMFAYEQFNIAPDVVTLAKGLGCGVPIGAFAMTQEASIGLEAGDHGTTYGGNPLVTATAATVMEIFKERKIPEHVKEVGLYLAEKLDDIVASYDNVKERRGIGLMQGIECYEDVTPYVQKALQKGLILIAASGNVIRFLPPLVIEKENVDEMISILKNVLTS